MVPADARRTPEVAGDETVAILAPTRRDAEVCLRLITGAGADAVICPDAEAVAARIGEGVGALLLTDVALAEPDVVRLLDALAAQPTWSDVPSVVLARELQTLPGASRVIERMTNVTLLERPASTRALLSAVRAALRGRRWQYRIRDQIDALTRAEEELRAADRRKDTFLATLSHELRNPLAPVRTGLRLLRHGGLDAAQRERTREAMERQVAQLTRLIDDLLDVSRIATGKLVLRMASLDLRDAVDHAIDQSLASRTAITRRHALSVERDDAPVPVRGDAQRLAQAIGNLLHNAIKYTPEGGHIRVTVRRDGAEARVEVTDDGEGIPTDLLDSVFEMFTQVDRTLDRAQGGLGIGLALVRSLVAQHGGRVEARSDGIDRGSTFEIRLPIDVAQPLAPPPAARRMPDDGDADRGTPRAIAR